MQKKLIVLDANILIRGVFGKKVWGIIERFSEELDFYTADVCYRDAEKYLPRIIERHGLSAESTLNILNKIKHVVTPLGSDVYGSYEQEAKQRIAVRDIDDWPIVASALFLDCPIWTEDADFFGTGVATWTSDRVHLYFE